MVLKSLIKLSILIFLTHESLAANNILCYYASWGANRPGNGKVVSSDIDPFQCTHIFYAFLGLYPNGSIQIMDEELDINQGNLIGLSNLKQSNPNLKTIFSIGGAAADTSVFSNVASNAETRQNLAQSTIELCQKYNFDGLDVDWEYPTDKATFIDLLKDLKAAFEPHGYLLAAAVDALPTNAAYDVPNMAKYLDIINVMSYDFHYSWAGKTGQNSPLYYSHLDGEWQRDSLNANASVTHWIQEGANPDQVAMGCGFYGHAFQLSDPAQHGLYDPSTGPADKGPYTDNLGTLGYNEICEFHPNGVVEWDDEQKVPFLYDGSFWVGYDNEQSLKVKAQYVIDKGLFGLMIWSVETDDTKGVCGGKWPLLAAIKEVMK